MLEIALRAVLGLGTPPLYEVNQQYGYRFQPNQHIYRFFNTFQTNALGLRGSSIQSNTRKVLKIGDSVFNGGILISEEKTSSNILEKKLNARSQDPIQVINISMGGWAPSNQLGFLKEHGVFQAEIAIIEWNNDDVTEHQVKFIDPTDNHSHNTPTQQPLSAITELIDRYLLPQLSNNYYLQEHGKFYSDSTTEELNPAIPDIIQLLKSSNIKPIIYIHPSIRELSEKKIDARGMLLIQYLEDQNIDYILGIEFMHPDLYRDGIHPNAAGHQMMANKIFEKLEALQIPF